MGRISMRLFSHHGKFLVHLLVFSLALWESRSGLGSSFEVSPIRVTFQANESTTLMTVRNDGQERLRLQVSVMGWDQNRQGEMVLAPTDDIIFYPNLLTIEPGAQRNLRLGANNVAVSKEQTYRIFVEELPSNQKFQTTGVRVVTKMSIPIFIKPAKADVRNSIDRIALQGSDFSFDVTNRGNVHIQPREVRVKGTGADGRVQLEKKIPGWYILAGGSREYRVELPKAECTRIKDLTVEVDLEDKSFTQNFAVPAGACPR